MPSQPWTYGNVIRAHRESRGWTQKELAEAVGVSSLAISKWENNAQNASTGHRLALAELFDIEASDLGVVGVPLGNADIDKRLERIEDLVKAIYEDCYPGNGADTTRSNAS